MDRTLGYTQTNRRSWNAIAPARRPEPPEHFRSGGVTLEDIEIEALPDVRGKRLLHMPCANGNDTLSWANLGAGVTGIDISDVAIEMAKDLAAAAGIDATFLAADMYQLPDDLGTFDIVYSSWGVVCWLPDLDRWANIVSGLLKPGGTFLLCEHHPLWEVLGIRGSGEVAVTVDYFGRDAPTKQRYDQAKRPSGSTPDTEFDAFLWPVSDVVRALDRAGMRIERFTEHPSPDMYRGLGAAAAWLPATYIVRATAGNPCPESE